MLLHEVPQLIGHLQAAAWRSTTASPPRTRPGAGHLTWSSKAFCLALCASTSLAICRKYSVRLPEASARAVACASK